MQQYRIAKCEGRGRCFQTLNDCKAGDAILFEDPYEAVLNDDSAGSRCHQDFEKHQQLLRSVQNNSIQSCDICIRVSLS